jgi:hypothetical protein
MAYVSQEKKKQLAPQIKDVLKKYGLKGTLRVRHHSELVLTIKSGKIDFIGNYNKIAGERYRGDRFVPASENMDINPYWYHEQFDGTAKKCLEELIRAMKGEDYFDHSDIQTDYFHCSHYYDINIGNWDKPYILEK